VHPAPGYTASTRQRWPVENPCKAMSCKFQKARCDWAGLWKSCGKPVENYACLYERDPVRSCPRPDQPDQTKHSSQTRTRSRTPVPPRNDHGHVTVVTDSQTKNPVHHCIRREHHHQRGGFVEADLGQQRN
jgi:hypothetical protein